LREHPNEEDRRRAAEGITKLKAYASAPKP
jgi:hypothetical protein